MCSHVLRGIHRFQGLARSSPGLAALSELLLGDSSMRPTGVHSSAEDALVAVRLVKHELEHGPTPPLDPPAVKVDTVELKKLCLHRVPAKATDAEVCKLFEALPGNTKPTAIERLSGKGRTHSFHALFASVADANAAFKALVGKSSPDSLGRPQKVGVKMAVGGGIAGVCVRKMAAHGGQLYGKDPTPSTRGKRPRERSKGREGKTAEAADAPPKRHRKT